MKRYEIQLAFNERRECFSRPLYLFDRANVFGITRKGVDFISLALSRLKYLKYHASARILLVSLCLLLGQVENQDGGKQPNAMYGTFSLRLRKGYRMGRISIQTEAKRPKRREGYSPGDVAVNWEIMRLLRDGSGHDSTFSAFSSLFVG